MRVLTPLLSAAIVGRYAGENTGYAFLRRAYQAGLRGSADTALMIPDFRSAERTFQLLCQVRLAHQVGDGLEEVESVETFGVHLTK